MSWKSWIAQTFFRNHSIGFTFKSAAGVPGILPYGNCIHFLDLWNEKAFDAVQHLSETKN